MNKVEQILYEVKHNNLVLYKELIDTLNSEYTRQQSEIKERLTKIKNGCKLGIVGDGFDEYYPVKFVSILNEKLGLVKVYESSIDTYHEVDVFELIYPKED